MYLSRTGSIFDLIVWLALAGMFRYGGLLPVTGAFRLHKRERLIAGLQLGFYKTWWRDLQPKQRYKIDQPCGVEIMKLSMPDKDFRWLLDIRECR